MTATVQSKITTSELSPSAAAPVNVRARAERLLLRVANHGENLLDNVTDPLDVPDYLVMALVETGRALVQLAELDAQQRTPVEVLLDGTGDLWVRVDADEDRFECVSSHDKDQSLEQIRSRFGIAREFVAAPPGDR